jgi:hypothetical protein
MNYGVIARTQSEAKGTKQSRNSAVENGEIATLPLVARNDINLTTLSAFATVNV